MVKNEDNDISVITVSWQTNVIDKFRVNIIINSDPHLVGLKAFLAVPVNVQSVYM